MKFPTVFKLSPLAAALFAISQPVYAEQDETVTVTGIATDASGALITSEELSNAQAMDLNDIFRQMSDINVGGNTNLSQKIYIRGLEDTMLNITVDGAEQSGNLFHHQGRLSIEPELLKQVTVQSGVGRATNGPGALGGAIAFETKDAHDLLSAGSKFGGHVHGGYYHNNEGKKLSASLYGEFKPNFGFLITGGNLKTDKIVDGTGYEQPYSDVDQQFGLIKVSGDINDSHYLSVSFEARKDDGERLNRPHWKPSFKNPTLEQEADRQTFNVNYALTFNEAAKLDTVVYKTNNQITHVSHPRWGTSQGIIETTGAKVTQTLAVDQHDIAFGIDYKVDKTEFNSTPLPGTGPKATHTEKGKVLGFFVQDDFQITDALLLSAGLRYDQYDLKDAQGLKHDSDGFSPNVYGKYTLENGLGFFASYAEAIRGQQTRELFIISFRGNDPKLDAEHAKNFETGFTFNSDIFFSGITFFDSEIDDVVKVDYASGLYKNSGTLKNRGINAYLGLNLGDFYTKVSYSQARPELNGQPLSDEDFTIGTAIGDTWVVNVNYQPTSNLDFGWNAQLVERLEDVAPGDPAGGGFPEKSGYGVHDVYGRWLPLQDDTLALTLSIKNVFDKYYYDHGSYVQYVGSPIAQGFANAGRDVRLSVNYKF